MEGRAFTRLPVVRRSRPVMLWCSCCLTTELPKLMTALQELQKCGAVLAFN